DGGGSLRAFGLGAEGLDARIAWAKRRLGEADDPGALLLGGLEAGLEPLGDLRQILLGLLLRGVELYKRSMLSAERLGNLHGFSREFLRIALGGLYSKVDIVKD